jgi:hypothetical protein
MSQYDFGIIDPYVMVGVELADALNQWRDAMYSLQRGSPRPTFIVPGQLWINDSAGPTNWQLMWYVSPTVGDVPLFSLNTVTGAVTISAAQGGTFNAAVLLAQAAASPSVQWNATGNPIDAKAWRMTVNGAGALVLSSYSDAGVLQQSITFNRDGSMPGAALQSLFKAYTNFDNSATPAIPADNTVPQNTEGKEVMFFAITPKSGASAIEVEVLGNFSPPNGSYCGLALFQDSNVNAIAAAPFSGNALDGIQVPLRFRVPSPGAGVTTTFHVRVGSSSGVTVYMNGLGNAAGFGGVITSSIKLTERLP